MTSEAKLAAITAILWPPDDPDAQWEPGRDLGLISVALGDEPPAAPSSPADHAVVRIHAVMEKATGSDADTIEDVSWVVEEYNSTHDPLKSRPKNPAPGGLLRGVITLGLTALGVTGIVMGIREVRRTGAPRQTTYQPPTT
jgi:hypothetical protein